MTFYVQAEDVVTLLLDRGYGQQAKVVRDLDRHYQSVCEKVNILEGHLQVEVDSEAQAALEEIEMSNEIYLVDKPLLKAKLVEFISELLINLEVQE